MHQQQTAFENIVRNEEIAHNKQFLLFPQCFLLNQVIVTALENIVGNEKLLVTSNFFFSHNVFN